MSNIFPPPSACMYCREPDGLQVRYVQQTISGCPLAATFLREKRDQSIVPSGTPLLAKNYPHHRLPRLFWLGWTSNWRKVFLLLCCQQFPSRASLLKGRMFISGHEQSPQVFSDFFPVCYQMQTHTVHPCSCLPEYPYPFRPKCEADDESQKFLTRQISSLFFPFPFLAFDPMSFDACSQPAFPAPACQCSMFWTLSPNHSRCGTAFGPWLPAWGEIKSLQPNARIARRCM